MMSCSYCKAADGGVHSYACPNDRSDEYVVFIVWRGALGETPPEWMTIDGYFSLREESVATRAIHLDDLAHFMKMEKWRLVVEIVDLREELKSLAEDFEDLASAVEQAERNKETDLRQKFAELSAMIRGFADYAKVVSQRE